MPNILVLNAGSSSYKLALYTIDKASIAHPQKPIWNCDYTWKEGAPTGHLSTFYNGKTLSNTTAPKHEPKSTLKTLLKQMVSCGAINDLTSIDIVGHRVVHGASAFTTPTLITPDVKAKIKSLSPLAPLHNPANLAGIEIIESLIPIAKQAAVFDTAFHSTLPEAASTYPGPYKWKEIGIKRYGFHGISHHYISLRCAELLKRDVNELNIISCHLGNGCSLAAISKGKSIDTTMGFTPLDGMMMGSRPGALDPGILTYLEQQKFASADSLFTTLNFNSGLQGISGTTSDMRDILKQRKEGHPRAALAFDMFCHSLRRNIGAMAGILNPIDALVFTAGIGENSTAIRAAGSLALIPMGAHLDVEKNQNNKPDTLISSQDSTIPILIIKTEEDWLIACACQSLFSG